MCPLETSKDHSQAYLQGFETCPVPNSYWTGHPVNLTAVSVGFDETTLALSIRHLVSCFVPEEAFLVNPYSRWYYNPNECRYLLLPGLGSQNLSQTRLPIIIIISLTAN